jgi:hypothetical protein
MKIFNIVFALIFLLFAFVQFNDPDPILWIAIYGAMAALCIMAVFNRYPQRVYLVLLVLLVGYSTLLIPSVLVWLRQEHLTDLFDEVAKMEHLYIEESREFLGLMICVSVLLFYLVKTRKSQKV